MKHLIRDSFIWLCSYFGVVRAYQRRLQKAGPLVRVIAFHDIADRRWFTHVIEVLQSTYHIVTPEEFVSSSFQPDKINVLITFDDGYDSWVTTVLPVLHEKNLKGIFFVSTGIIETAEDSERSARFMQERLLVSPKQPLTKAGLIALHKAGQIIGGHTHSHVSLGAISHTDLVSEVSSNQLLLQDFAGNQIIHFAYPFGTAKDFTQQTTAYIHEVGFRHVYSAITGFYSQDLNEIPRTLVEKNQSASSICRWIEGGYDIFAGIIRYLK